MHKITDKKIEVLSTANTKSCQTIFDLYLITFCFQGEESLNLLKSLPLAEAEKVAERLSIWARLVLQKEADNSEEVLTNFTSQNTCTLSILNAAFSTHRKRG